VQASSFVTSHIIDRIAEHLRDVESAENMARIVGSFGDG
jgi:hypothetical protein